MSQKVNFKRILFTTHNTPFDIRAVPTMSLVPNALKQQQILENNFRF